MCVMNGNEENVKIAPGLPYDSKNMANLIRSNYTVCLFFFISTNSTSKLITATIITIVTINIHNSAPSVYPLTANQVQCIFIKTSTRVAMETA